MQPNQSASGGKVVSLCTCAGLNLTHVRRSERGRLGWTWLDGGSGTSQSSDEHPALALLSRKLDYNAADPPKLRPGVASAR